MQAGPRCHTPCRVGGWVGGGGSSNCHTGCAARRQRVHPWQLLPCGAPKAMGASWAHWALAIADGSAPGMHACAACVTTDHIRRRQNWQKHRQAMDAGAPRSHITPPRLSQIPVYHRCHHKCIHRLHHHACRRKQRTHNNPRTFAAVPRPPATSCCGWSVHLPRAIMHTCACPFSPISTAAAIGPSVWWLQCQARCIAACCYYWWCPSSIMHHSSTSSLQVGLMRDGHTWDQRCTQH